MARSWSTARAAVCVLSWLLVSGVRADERTSVVAQDPLSAGYPPPLLEPRPHSGIGGAVVGWAGLGLGALNLATLPLCALDYYERHDLRGICIGTSLALGAAGLAAGVPGLVIGYKRRRAYKAWRARQGLLSRLGFSLAGDRAWFAYRQHW